MMIPLEAKLIASGIGLVLLFVVFGIYRHSLIAEGEQRVRDANTKQAEALQKQANELTQKWQDKADVAEHMHDNELIDLRTYRESHPIGKLCLDTPGSPGYLPPAARPNPRNVGTSSQSATVQHVPAGDSNVPSNRAQMLDALAAAADRQSAALREWQERVSQ